MKRECPGCKQRVPVAKQKNGTWVVCPACGRLFKLTAPALSLPAIRPRRIRGLAATLGIGLPVLLLCTAIVVAVVITTRGQVPTQTPSQSAPLVAPLLRMKGNADELAAGGRLAEAIAAYQQLRHAAGDLRDPAVVQIVQNARRSEALASAQLEATLNHAPPPRSTLDNTEVARGPTPAPSPPVPQTLPARRPVLVASQSVPRPATQASPRYTRAPLRPDPQPLDDLDQQIGHSIERGVSFLLHGMDPHRRSLVPISDPQGQVGGADALVVFALLQASQAIDDPRLKPGDPFMEAAIAKLKSRQFGRWQVYGRGLRCAALAVYDRKQDREVLRADAEWLVKATGSGAYTYERGFPGPPPPASGPPHDPSRPAPGDAMAWDNSNSQYGLLGVWSAAERGFEVPSHYWQAVESHWTYYQLPDGQWFYGRGNDRNPRVSMTCAGIASLFVTHDYLDGPKYANDVGREPFSPALKNGLDWLEAGDHSTDLHVVSGESASRNWAYNLFGLERVGLASGFKYFGAHDWYRELAREAIGAQESNGSWRRDSIIDTAYMVLFLSRGRHPILMNKLRFNGYWANRPRAEANLARFASRELERPLNWQVVPIDHEWTDWADSPILSISSHRGTIIDEPTLQKLRTFAMAGGLLFLNDDGDSPEFDGFAKALCAKLFPDYELTDVPANHPIYSVVYPMKLRPPLKMVSNGARALVIYSPTDITRHWQARDEVVGRRFYELGVNLFVYAAGKRDLRNRLDSTYVPPPSASPVQTVAVARLKYAGAWDPEPLAWPRFARVFGRRTGYAIQGRAVSIPELSIDTAPVAHLTGAFAYTFTDAEVRALRRYVESGGVLLIDSCGGGGAFAQSADDLLSRAFPGASPDLVQPTDPLLSPGSDGMQDLSKPRLRPFTVDVLGSHAGAFRSIRWGAGHVVFTPLDLTSGLLGTQTWGILGYDPAYAQDLMQNVILWALDGQKD